MMKVRISAVIITFNEERNIERCLKSLQGVADEIIVVDSYSKDRTEEICHSFNVRFIKHKFTGHIQQKNWAILQASSPFILSLDADEALSDQLRTSILNVKGNWTHDGYYFNRLTNYCGKWIRHTSWYPSKKLRLWDARKGGWGGFNPHDKYYLKKGGTQRFLKGDLLHYSYYSVSEHIVQMNSFSAILARSYYERGKRVYFSNIVFNPLWRFLKDYLLKAGILDGYYGFIISVNSAHEVFLKYVQLINIYKEKKRSQKQTICFFNSMKTWGGGEKWHHDVATYLSDQQHRTLVVSSPGSPLFTQMNGSGIPGYGIRISNLSFMNLVKVYKLVRIFKKEKVGTLVTSLSSDMKVASIAAKIAGVPRIIYRRGSAIPIRDSLLNRYLLRRVVTTIVANSNEVKRTILVNNEALVPENKITIIYNGVYLHKFSQKVAPLIPARNGEIVLGCAGRLSEEKGHIYLLELLSELKGSPYKFRLLIAGVGRLLHSLEKKAKELNVDQQVEFIGFTKDMPAFYRSLDIFLLTSRYEGFSNVINEAMASSLPVVVFDIKSSSEVIDHGVSGFITRNGDIKEMSERVLELAGDKELRSKMGSNARKHIEKLFSLDILLDEIEKLFTRSNGL